MYLQQQQKGAGDAGHQHPGAMPASAAVAGGARQWHARSAQGSSHEAALHALFGVAGGVSVEVGNAAQRVDGAADSGGDGVLQEQEQGKKER